MLLSSVLAKSPLMSDKDLPPNYVEPEYLDDTQPTKPSVCCFVFDNGCTDANWKLVFCRLNLRQGIGIVIKLGLSIGFEVDFVNWMGFSCLMWQYCFPSHFHSFNLFHRSPLSFMNDIFILHRPPTFVSLKSVLRVPVVAVAVAVAVALRTLKLISSSPEVDSSILTQYLMFHLFWQAFMWRWTHLDLLCPLMHLTHALLPLVLTARS